MTSIGIIVGSCVQRMNEWMKDDEIWLKIIGVGCFQGKKSADHHLVVSSYNIEEGKRERETCIPPVRTNHLDILCLQRLDNLPPARLNNGHVIIIAAASAATTTTELLIIAHHSQWCHSCCWWCHHHRGSNDWDWRASWWYHHPSALNSRGRNNIGCQEWGGHCHRRRRWPRGKPGDTNNMTTTGTTKRDGEWFHKHHGLVVVVVAVVGII